MFILRKNVFKIFVFSFLKLKEEEMIHLNEKGQNPDG